MGAFQHITFAGKSDIGRKRKNNEDAFGVFPSHGVFCVADGMGGGDDGEVASAATVGAVEKFVKSHPEPADAAFTGESVAAGIRSAVNGVSNWIFERAKSRNLKGCGSTFVGVCLDPAHPDEAVALHAGDSRLYRIRGRGIKQMTKDHSAAELIGAKDESDLNPMFRGMILRAVGILPSVEIDVTPISLKEGDVIVICSDGLCRMVPDKRIASIVRDNDDPAAAVDALVAAANDAGGIDNVTVVVVKVGKLPQSFKTVDIQPECDASAAHAAGGREAAVSSSDGDTNPSFGLAADDSDDAASFATATQTSATATGATGDRSVDSVSRETLVGSDWPATDDAPVGEPERKRIGPVMAAAAAAIAIAAISTTALIATSGKSRNASNGNVDNGRQDPAPRQEVAVAEKFATEEEEQRKKAEADMAEKIAEMQRQLEEAKEKAERDQAERDAELKRLEAERKAAEEARLKAEEDAARIAAERKAAEERRKAEEMRIVEEARKEEERSKAEEALRIAEARRAEAQRKAEEERRAREQAALEKAAREKAELEKAEARRREEERRKALEAQRKAKEEAERMAALMETVRPMLEDAIFYLDNGEIKGALTCLKSACGKSYVLPRDEWFPRINELYQERLQFLSRHIHNRSMAASKNLDPAKLKAEFKELQDLFGALRFDKNKPAATER